MQVKLFPNVTSIPFDYTYISTIPFIKHAFSAQDNILITYVFILSVYFLYPN